MLMNLKEFMDANPGMRRDEAYWKFAEYFRDNAQVGDGVSVHLWSDAHAYTIIKRTAKTLTLQRAKAEYADGWKPEYIPGGFSAICLNDDEQKWKIEPDPNGSIIKAYWSEKNGGFYVGKVERVTAGYYEHYDHNF